MKRVAGLSALLLVATACGGGEATPTTTTAPPTTTTAAPTTTLAPTTTTAAPTTTLAPTTTISLPAVSVALTDLGEVVVDPEGMTLYLFLPDDQGPSTCSGGCATTWPPLTATVVAGAGLDPALLDTTTRTDGTVQVTYNGWPLYRYAGDSEPGDTAGQSLGGNWWVVDAAGDPVM